MKQQIKNIRICIDSLIELTKTLYPDSFYVIDIAQRPDNISIEDYINQIKKTGVIISDSSKVNIQNLNHKHMPTFYRELEEAKKHLILAHKWLGKIIEYTTAETYLDDDKVNPLIMNDVYNESEFESKNYIEKINYLIDKINEIIKTKPLDFDFSESDTPFETAYTHEEYNLFQHLTEATFWLELEIDRVKEKEPTTQTN